MNVTQLASLKKSVRETLSSGMAIAVIGWKDSNHSSTTRSLLDDKVLFFEDPPNQLGKNVGFVLFTRFVKHKDYDRFKQRKDCHSVVLGTGRIKEVIESCGDVLIADSSSSLTVNKSESPEVVTSDTSSNHRGSDDLLEFLTQPTKEKPQMNQMQKFSTSFLSFMGSERKELIGSKLLGKLIDEFGIKRTPQQLIKDGWVQSVVKEGTKRAHWYKAGRLMLGHEDNQEKPLPETAAGRVELLMSLEPELQEEKIKLEERLAEIDRKLAMIVSARTMFDQLESEFAKK